MQTKNPLFQMFKVKGGHHVHLTHPHRISGPIIEFLHKYRLKKGRL